MATLSATAALDGIVTLAEARGRGLTYGQWRNPRLDRVTTGVRSTEPVADVSGLARATALVLPRPFAYSHVSAGQLWDLPLPPALEGRLVLDVLRPAGTSRIIRQGCTGHRGLERREVVARGGLPVTSLQDTWVDLASLAPEALSLDDLIVLGDAILFRLGDLIPDGPEPEEVRAVMWRAERTAREYAGAAPDWRADPAFRSLCRAIEARRRPRGARLLAEAKNLIRPNVRSPMETRSRLMAVRAGFPCPEPNAPVTDEAGGWLMMGDLVWIERRVVAEYQGAPHGSLRARSKDAERRRRAEDADWAFLEIYAADVFDPARRSEWLSRLDRALKRRLARPPGATRVGNMRT